MKCVISVLGADRTGIVAAVATVLTECDANIDDINQTMLATLNIATASFEEVQDRLTAEGERLGVQITIQREDVFRFMHEI